jgi:hypothetical protein
LLFMVVCSSEGRGRSPARVVVYRATSGAGAHFAMRAACHFA